jgi:hypothetical protein
MRVFNVLLDGRVKPGHNNGGRFGAATAVFRFKRAHVYRLPCIGKDVIYTLIQRSPLSERNRRETDL